MTSFSGTTPDDISLYRPEEPSPGWAGRPRVMALVDHWSMGAGVTGDVDESAVVVRSVLSALALEATVEVFADTSSSGVEGPTIYPDGVFTVRHMTGDDPETWWAPARAMVRDLPPDLVVVAGTAHLADLENLVRSSDITVVHVPAHPNGLGTWPGSHTTLVSCGAEREMAASGADDVKAVTDVGLHVPAASDSSSATAPLQTQELAAVIHCSTSALDDSSPETSITRALADRWVDQGVAAIFSDGLVISTSHGVRRTAVPDNDTRWALQSAARCVVDLSDGAVVALRTLEALRAGTPVVARLGTRAHDQVLRSGGGLGCNSREELFAAVERLQGDEGRTMGAAGQRWAEDTHGSRRSFVARVHGAVIEALARRADNTDATR